MLVRCSAVPFSSLWFLHRIYRRVGTKAAEAGVEVVCDCDLGLLQDILVGDPFRLRQCLLNLARRSSATLHRDQNC